MAVLERQNETRVPWLVPVRHDRMRVSPFTFYRGAAGIMAGDLASTPTSGLTVQLGGDAHLSNFGASASPGRPLVFDANDFDETQRGPWEWDLKRLAGEEGVRRRDRSVRTARSAQGQPPVLFPARALPAEHDATALEAEAHAAIDTEKGTLDDSQRFLLDRHTIVDVAVMVVGVGSVGTRCLVILL